MACLCGLMRQLTVVTRRTYPCLNNTNLTHQVRWRKPRWVPVAKTKVFNVREPTPINAEEDVELFKEFNSYRTELKTIRTFLVKWQQDIKTEDISEEELQRAEEEEHRRLMEINRQWNAEVAVQREKRQKEEVAAKQLRKRKEQEQEEDEELEMLEQASRYVQLESEQAKTFVTEETLDEEVEKVLNMRKDYNFAIDAEGNKVTYENKDAKKSEQAG
ncbi:small ribosomal subunit protein mS26-like [Liolophura sinensis]|uniref:small ribosomal subunit protein mS26-like n=1 Tax=Liolophura sinensis TaxID=3198878 RepID=UPI0031586EB1